MKYRNQFTVIQHNCMKYTKLYTAIQFITYVTVN